MDLNLVNNIRLTQANGSAVYKGTYNGYAASMNACFFYSDLNMSNYFNLASDSKTFTNTAGITSSSGKKVKFSIQLLASKLYYLTLGYQDGSKVQNGDVFTFNLTPDKNALLDPIYQNTVNVQDAIETLAARNIYDYSGTETICGTYQKNNMKKNIYRLRVGLGLNMQKESDGKFIVDVSNRNIEYIINMGVLYQTEGNSYNKFFNSFNSTKYNIAQKIYFDNSAHKIVLLAFSYIGSDSVFIEYTKKTDSWQKAN